MPEDGVWEEQRVKTSGGIVRNMGATPARPPPAPTRPKEEKEVWARATDDYEAGDERELGFKAGEDIRILRQDPNGWWTGELRGKRGFVPSTYLELSGPPPAR